MNTPFKPVVTGRPALPRQTGYSYNAGDYLTTVTPRAPVSTFGTAASPRSIGAPIANPVSHIPFLGGSPIVGPIANPVGPAPFGGPVAYNPPRASTPVARSPLSHVVSGLFT